MDKVILGVILATETTAEFKNNLGEPSASPQLRALGSSASMSSFEHV